MMRFQLFVAACLCFLPACVSLYPADTGVSSLEKRTFERDLFVPGTAELSVDGRDQLSRWLEQIPDEHELSIEVWAEEPSDYSAAHIDAIRELSDQRFTTLVQFGRESGHGIYLGGERTSWDMGRRWWGGRTVISVMATQAKPPAAPAPSHGEAMVGVAEFGDDFFLPGDDALSSKGRSELDAFLTRQPPGVEFGIDVWAEGRHHPHAKRGNALRLSHRRSWVIADVMRERGFRVQWAKGRGFERVDGREADRRTVITVLAVTD